ncbi:MAG: cadherin-like beta sandwich domain-containing protein [Oscillospiraceae bacterium]|nr:cadherin-like beta sandwich domain-containing protein [Oscillospiraceae bacterium]
MKRSFVRFLAVCLLAALLALPRQAEAAGVSLSGSTDGIRPGDTVTLTLYASGSGLTAINGSFSGMSGMSLSNVSSARSGWTVTLNGNTFTTYDTAMTNPINSSAAVLTATFTVSSGASSGSAVSAGVSGVTASDTNSTISLGSASWSATVAAPLSGNANLSSLTCAGASLSPSFSADVTNYSVTVPFSVTALDLDYTRAHSGSWVTVSGNDLVVGANTVTLTVTAENGSRKQYYISVTREQDPDYKASDNALLSSLSVSAGAVSPAFDPDTKEYVVYVPFEVKQISLSGTAQDEKALQVKGASSFLKPGDNPLRVVCTAEDGTTACAYVVHVFRLPFFKGAVPQVLPGDEDPAVPAVEPVTPDQPEENDLLSRAAALAQAGVTVPLIGESVGPVPLWALCAAGLFLLLLLFYVLGTLVGKAVGRKKALRSLPGQPEPPAEDEPDDDGPSFPPVPPPIAPEAPAEDAPAEETPAEETPAEETPAEETPAEGAPAEENPAEKAPVEETPAEETPAEETPAEDAPAEETPAEETSAEETPVEDAATEEAPAGDAPAGETPSAPPEDPSADDLVRTMSLDELLKDIRNM